MSIEAMRVLPHFRGRLSQGSSSEVGRIEADAILDQFRSGTGCKQHRDACSIVERRSEPHGDAAQINRNVEFQRSADS
jgi:hypothetical protein